MVVRVLGLGLLEGIVVVGFVIVFLVGFVVVGCCSFVCRSGGFTAIELVKRSNDRSLVSLSGTGGKKKHIMDLNKR